MSISIRGENANFLRGLKNNFFINIFTEIYRDLTNSNDLKFKFEFQNKIPLSRGLGSSSAVIVAAITAAYEMAGVPIQKDKIINLALKQEPHPDNITPATLGGFCVAKLKREKVYFLKKYIPTYLKAVVVIPDKPISTAQSRNKLPTNYTTQDVVTNISSSSMITAAFFAEKFDLLRFIVEDKVHQEYRMKVLPELFRVREIALMNGSLMSTLSGSGSTFFNLCYKKDAINIAEAVKREFPGFKVKILNFDNDGVKVYHE